MGDLVELLAERRVERRVAVAVDVAPERADAVEVAAALDVDTGRPPRPRSMTRGSDAAQSASGVNGCQRWALSQARRVGEVGVGGLNRGGLPAEPDGASPARR